MKSPLLPSFSINSKKKVLQRISKDVVGVLHAEKVGSSGPWSSIEEVLDLFDPPTKTRKVTSSSRHQN